MFVHNTQTATTTRVSVDSAGNQGNNFSIDPDISDDGRYVTCYSGADNLVPGDTNTNAITNNVTDDTDPEIVAAAAAELAEGTDPAVIAAAVGRGLRSRCV